MLNFACGSRIHKDFENIDFYPINENIKKINLLQVLPYNDNTFDIAYSSHFLEHLDKDNAKKILKEIRRILKDDGILRIVVPDLENIAREYIKLMDCDDNSFKHEWIVIEMLDQIARSKMGGGMQEIFDKVKSNNNIEYAKYIEYRVGDRILEANKLQIGNKKITIDKMKNKILMKYINLIKMLIPKSIRNEVFVSTSIGERHKFMYDRISLRHILESCDFRDIKMMSFDESQIPNFNTYLLDINSDGSPYKGISSIYIECRK